MVERVTSDDARDVTAESNQALLAELRERLERQRVLVAALLPADRRDLAKAEVARSLLEELASLRRAIDVLERAVAADRARSCSGLGAGLTGDRSITPSTGANQRHERIEGT